MHADEVLRRGANAGLFPQFTFSGLQQRFIGLRDGRPAGSTALCR